MQILELWEFLRKCFSLIKKLAVNFIFLTKITNLVFKIPTVLHWTLTVHKICLLFRIVRTLQYFKYCLGDDIMIHTNLVIMRMHTSQKALLLFQVFNCKIYVQIIFEMNWCLFDKKRKVFCNIWITKTLTILYIIKYYFNKCIIVEIFLFSYLYSMFIYKVVITINVLIVVWFKIQ